MQPPCELRGKGSSASKSRQRVGKGTADAVPEKAANESGNTGGRTAPPARHRVARRSSHALALATEVGALRHFSYLPRTPLSSAIVSGWGETSAQPQCSRPS